MASPELQRLETGREASPAPFRVEIVHPYRTPSPWRPSRRHLLLLLATIASVFLAGAVDQGGLDVHAGVEAAAAVLAILGSHEMGHFIACRLYDVDATLPYFIPALWLPLGGWSLWFPLPFMGTFGAVIRIRDRFPNRKALFDIGIAGPLAGFIVCVPVLILGLHQAQVVPDAGPFETLGEPLAFKLAASLFLKAPPPGMTILIGPVGKAAWFGFLITALNLMPVGQLDGGHVVYALFRERALLVSRIAWWCCVGLIFVSPSWIVWAVFLHFLGKGHPRTVDDESPFGRGRILVALLGLGVLVASFMPDPLPGAWKDFGELGRALLSLWPGR